jgi:hypothetical protein
VVVGGVGGAKKFQKSCTSRPPSDFLMKYKYVRNFPGHIFAFIHLVQNRPPGGVKRVFPVRGEGGQLGLLL